MADDMEIEDTLSRDPVALAAIRSLPPSHKREYVDWIAGAKQPGTRGRRIAKMIDMLNGKASHHGQG